MNKRKKHTEKFALRAIAIVMLWFIFLWVLASFMGCNNNCMHKTENVSHLELDNVMDSVKMDCGE